MKIVIIGGVAGGATAAARLRRMDEHVEIIMIERGAHISYANCGLPYYIGNVITDRNKLFLQSPQGFAKRFNVDVRTEQEVTAIIPEAGSLTVKRKDGSLYQETYDRLLIATGASPVRPPLPGIDHEAILTLRNVADTDRIKDFIDRTSPRRAVVIGAGFIGLEMVENLKHRGLDVHVVEMGNQVMAPTDFSMAAWLHQHLISKGVHLHLGQTVAGFQHANHEVIVNLKSGRQLSTDLVVLSIGVRPEASLAQSCGLEIGQTGGIVVDHRLQTSHPSIYAIGDAIEYPHPLTGRPWLNLLAGPANRQGRIAADNMLGADIAYEGSIGTAIAKVFDMTVATSGLPAKRLKEWGIPHTSITVHPASHAGYYPDSTQLTLKLTFDPTDGKLLGGQAIGYEGVDKRMDQIALVLKQGGSIYDLMKVEHAYAPPFSSAKDPVAMAAYAANNIIEGRMKPVYWREMQQLIAQGAYLLDVRTPHEYQVGTLPGAVNIPLDELRHRLNELPRDGHIYVFCAVGLRGYLASRILLQHGFQHTYNLVGGLRTYRAATAEIPHPHSQPGSGSPHPSTPPSSPVQSVQPTASTVRIDACGLQCPGPILQLKKAIDSLQEGQEVEIISTDAGFARDAQAWCQSTGNRWIGCQESAGKVVVTIAKQSNPRGECSAQSTGGKGKTLILFSDDLDKALATFVLANGAAVTGQPTTIFFTFWGLNVIKKEHKPRVEKDLFGRMFGWMLPAHSRKLKLSKMNMGGMGSLMMRFLMRKKGIESLESLRRQALENGVEFIACQMSMDVMGVKREELMDEVSIGGVATYMERADKANVNLFI